MWDMSLGDLWGILINLTPRDVMAFVEQHWVWFKIGGLFVGVSVVWMVLCGLVDGPSTQMYPWKYKRRKSDADYTYEDL
jgi:hypothetical protein